MQSPHPPQIIVIPNSMLQSQSLLKISRPISPYRVISSNASQPILNRTVLSSNSNTYKPVATVIGNKRPASSVFNEINKELEFEGEPNRKRTNLDHLSSEEKLMRRKMKNRVAAQTARDKKRTATDDMERIISELEADKKSLLEKNIRLQSANTHLQVENVSLQKENKDLESLLCQDTIKERKDIGIMDKLQLEIPLSPASLAPLSPLTLTFESPLSCPHPSPVSLSLESPTSPPPTLPVSLPIMPTVISLHPSSSFGLSPPSAVSTPQISRLSTNRLFSTSPVSQQPPESAAGAGLQWSSPVQSATRVVVSGLDSLGKDGPDGLSEIDLVCSVSFDQEQELSNPNFESLPCQNSFSTLFPSASKDEIQGLDILDPSIFLNIPSSRVGTNKLCLDTLCSNDNTLLKGEVEPSMNSTETMLDIFLVKDKKWVDPLDDLFLELD